MDTTTQVQKTMYIQPSSCIHLVSIMLADNKKTTNEPLFRCHVFPFFFIQFNFIDYTEFSVYNRTCRKLLKKNMEPFQLTFTN